MYAKLKLLFKDKNISYKEAAKEIGCSYSTFCEKMNGNSDFTIDEAQKLRNKYFPELTLDEVFEKLELRRIRKG